MENSAHILSFDKSMLLIKVLTELVIVLVWLDDLESAFINLWGAEIYPLESEG